MAFLLVVVSIALVVCLGLLIFGRGAPAHHRAPAPGLPAASTATGRSGPDPELEKRRREVDELKATVAELRGELKQTRKKLHDQRAGDKDGTDLVKARTEVERSASQQLEVVRSELAGALAEVGRLRSESEAFRTRRPVAAAPTPVAAPAAVPVASPLPPAPEARRFRELSDTDREKMDRLEHLANRERSRAQELSAEVRRLKGRTETQARVYTVVRGELDLLKDKFKALEKRLNRTLLERDLLRRAIRDLEKKSGLASDRTELTADEVAASDRSVEDRAAAEAAEIARRTRPPEPDVPPPPASSDPAVSGATVEPSAPGGAPAPAHAGAEQHTEKAG
ncbi:MAG: cell envelope biogenesis protein TolA [Myxococcaceae bacterium]